MALSRRFLMFTVLFLALIFFCLDQTLKWLSLHNWHYDLLLNSYMGWHPFLNPGIAFGLPVPQVVILSLTFPVLLILVAKIYDSAVQIKIAADTNRKRQLFLSWAGLVFILAGATSNFIDRVLYRVTVDYFLLYTAIINLADVMIVVGFALYFISILNNKKLPKEEYVSQT